MTKRRRASGISIFFPAFNDEKTIGGLVREAFRVLPSLTDDYEVIVVNDGSSDATADVLEDLERVFPSMQVITHDENRGYGAALRSGFRCAAKDLIFYTDGDGQYDVRELAALIPHLTNSCDVVNGYKLSRADPRRRKLAGAMYNHLARRLFRLPIRDVDCDFRLIRGSALDSIELVSSSGVICVEMIHKLQASGCIFAEAPVQHYERAHGKSQFFTPKRVARTLVDLLALWIRLVVLRRASRSRA
jgi:glycosyltransferase involved in cell wall biosynthesis